MLTMPCFLIRLLRLLVRGLGCWQLGGNLHLGRRYHCMMPHRLNPLRALQLKGEPFSTPGSWEAQSDSAIGGADYGKPLDGRSAARVAVSNRAVSGLKAMRVCRDSRG